MDRPIRKILSRLQAKMAHLGADYADLRYVEGDRERLRTKDGKMDDQRQTHSRGVGIRVLAANAFGFSATSDLSAASLERHLKQAYEMAVLFSKSRRAEIKLAAPQSVQDEWSTPVKKDPWKITLQEKIQPSIQTEKELLSYPHIASTSSVLDFTRKRTLFLSSEGSRIEQTLYRTGGWLSAESWIGREKILRTYPGPSGYYRAGGYEVICGMRFEKELPRLTQELKELRRAPEAPAGTFDLILKGSILALQIHETFGHASESDRVYGYEDNYGGRTFLNPGLLGGFQVASPQVTIVSDASTRSGPGTGSFAYDDDGVKARSVEIIGKGFFQGYLTSRETASFLDEKVSSANAVAQDAFHYPLIRMTNLNLMPGAGTLEEMIAGTEEGFLLDNELSWSIDQMRLDFQIGAEAGAHIKNGKIQGFVRFPYYRANTLDFWQSCDLIAGKDDWIYWGFSDCGKGGPYQEAFTGHGISPARFRKINFGRA